MGQEGIWGRREYEEGEKGLKGPPNPPLPKKGLYLCWPWHTFPHAASTAQISCQADALNSPSSFWGSSGRAARLNSPL